MTFVSIRTRLMGVTALLVVAVVGAVVWRWTQEVRANERSHLEDKARASAQILAKALLNELDDENWSQIRIAAEMLMVEQGDFVYVMVSDARKHNRIIAAAPSELTERYVPDVVRLDVTHRALALAGGTLSVETPLLRSVSFQGRPRARRGQPIVEVATPVLTASGSVIGTFRVGISLSAMEAAVAVAARHALSIGALALIVGLLGAWYVAQRMTRPLRDLDASARQIADGDLEHRAHVRRSDELGRLARSFNAMTEALQISFAELRATLESFERFVPRKFMQVIAPEGISNVQVGIGSQRRVSVLFSDIRGWTSLSEDMAPPALFEFLNDYLGRMGRAIDEHGGFIDKYIGDAIMALFDDEHSDGAIDAAIEMRHMLAAFNRERVAAGLPPIENGIGVHTGDVVMGTIGFASRIDPTAIGDAVNLASRVEGLTKHYQRAILITGAAVEGLRARDHYRLDLVDAAVKVRGKDDTIAVYEVSVP